MKKLSLSLISVLFLALSSFGQTALNQTTLAAAVGDGIRTITLTSATGVTAGTTMLFVGQEAMVVNAVSGTTVTVRRGAQGTASVKHIILTNVLVGPLNAFITYDPSGTCTNGQGVFLYSPVVNVQNGRQWLCSTVTGEVVPGFGNFSQTPAVTTAVASAAGATLPSGPLFHVTGTNAITAWGSSTTLGAVGAGGGSANIEGAPFCVIPNAVFTTTATNNIALATTAVVNKTLCYTFDGTNKKYVPSY